MDKLKTGLTSRTTKNLQINAGVLLSAYEKGGDIDENNIIGATRGGGSFVATAVMHDAAVDGAPTNTVGLRRIDGHTATLNMTCVEFTAPAIRRAIVGSTQNPANPTKTDDIVISAVAEILESDYKDVYWVGDLADGRNAVILLKNALNTNGFNLSFSDKGEGTFALQLEANYGKDEDGNYDLYTAPFEITIEGESA